MESWVGWAISPSTEFIVWLCIQVKLLARHIGKPIEEIAQDIRRPKYFSPSEAVDYGIIDKVNNLMANQTRSDLPTTNSNLHVLQVIYNEKIQEDGGVVSELKRSNLI
jgi:ATP-dependent Clp protease protease subunit